MLDFLIKNAQIIDGTGKAPFIGNVGICKGEIAYIGADNKAAHRVIDATGKCVAPGFIDMHSHSDYTLPVYPNAESAIGQGITTMVAGNCGMSPSPCERYYTPFCIEETAMAEVLPEPIGGVNPGFMQIVPPELLQEAYKKKLGSELAWRSFGEYTNHLNNIGIAPNLIAMAGHGQIRLQVLGYENNRASTPDEIAEIVALCNKCMDEGAAGISFGLDYAPGWFADEAEMEAVARCVASRGKILAAHYQLRQQRRGKISDHTPLDGMIEMLELAKKTGVHVHLSHLCGSFPPESNSESALRDAQRRTIEMIAGYREQGVTVTYDSLCYYTGGDFFYPNIAHSFLPYVINAGGMERFSAALKIGNYKQLIHDDIWAGMHPSSSVMTRLIPMESPLWGSGVQITRCSNKNVEGKTLDSLCAETGKDYVAVLLDILRDDPYACYNIAATEAYQEVVPEGYLTTPDMCIGLDVSAVDYGKLPEFKNDRPNNRRSTGTYCGFIKYLTSGREPIEQLVRHLTSVPAMALGLTDRGILEEGAKADIVVFEPAGLRTNENFIDPCQRPEGIEYVFVNGVAALDGAKQTHARSGKVIV